MTIKEKESLIELVEITSDFISLIRTNLTYEITDSTVRKLDKIEDRIYHLRSTLDQCERKNFRGNNK